MHHQSLELDHLERHLLSRYPGWRGLLNHAASAANAQVLLMPAPAGGRRRLEIRHEALFHELVVTFAGWHVRLDERDRAQALALVDALAQDRLLSAVKLTPHGDWLSAAAYRVGQDALPVPDPTWDIQLLSWSGRPDQLIPSRQGERFRSTPQMDLHLRRANLAVLNRQATFSDFPVGLPVKVVCLWQDGYRFEGETGVVIANDGCGYGITVRFDQPRLLKEWKGGARWQETFQFEPADLVPRVVRLPRF